jgi:hypothetical protein
MFSPTTLLIIIVAIAIIFAIGAYQLVINKYYWGPKGPPKKNHEQKHEKKRTGV